MSSRSLRAVAPTIAGLVILVTLAGCVTGKRPTLGAKVDSSKPISQQALNIEAVDAVLVPLESSESLTYTAKYTITPTTGTTEVEAVVSQQPGQRSVTIGDIRFLHGATDVTCNLTKKVCEPGMLDQRVSNIPGASSTFDRGSPAAKMRITAPLRKTTLYASKEAFELQVTTCVNFPNGKAADTYCIVPTGQLARVERTEANIVLTSLSPEPNPALFERGDGA